MALRHLRRVICRLPETRRKCIRDNISALRTDSQESTTLTRAKKGLAKTVLMTWHQRSFSQDYKIRGQYPKIV